MIKFFYVKVLKKIRFSAQSTKHEGHYYFSIIAVLFSNEISSKAIDGSNLFIELTMLVFFCGKLLKTQGFPASDTKDDVHYFLAVRAVCLVRLKKYIFDSSQDWICVSQ